jgi:hypothetical protein
VVQWLAYAIPYRRFADILTNACARLGANADRYSFIAVDFHHILLASLLAHAALGTTLPAAPASACARFRFRERPFGSTLLDGESEHPAGNLKSKFARNGELRSGFSPIGPVLFEDVEDDGAEMSAKRADSLVVFLALSSLFLVVAL